MTNAAKNSLPLCPTSQNVLSQEERILIHILLEQALLNIFSFSFFSCRGSMTIFLASPPNNVLTPRMSQGHINIQILSSIWIKHCNVWTVFSIDVLVLFDGEGEGQTDKQTDRQTDKQRQRQHKHLQQTYSHRLSDTGTCML